MTETDLAAFRRDLLAWYKRHARPLPWRLGPPDPYRTLLSEVLLQQTQVARGLAYYERLVAAYPTVGDLAAAPLGEFLKLWAGAGYYARARNLHRAAGLIAAGGMPDTLDGLARLPGVGRYTAGAVASIAYGLPVPVVDGNVRRVLARVFLEPRPAGGWLWARAETVLERGHPGDWNQALMELGARVCVPRSPRCGECPVSGHCQAYREGRQGTVPAPKPRTAAKAVRAVALVAGSNGRYRLEQRPETGLLGGLHGFPLEASDGDDEAALARLLARFGLEPRGSWAGEVSHAMTHRRLTVRVYRLEPEGAGLEHPDEVALPRLDRKILGVVEAGPLFDSERGVSSGEPEREEVRG